MVVVTPNAGSARSGLKDIETLSGQKITACYQCEKCTSGCPLTFAMDLMPHQVIHLLNLGEVDRVLNSDTIWVCASCQTCTARCPNGIDIARVMDSLKQQCLKQGIKPCQYSVPIFHEVFLNSVKRRGRLHETELALTYSIEDAGWLGFLKLAGMGFAMFLRGKIRLRGQKVRALSEVREIFKRTKELSQQNSRVILSEAKNLPDSSSSSFAGTPQNDHLTYPSKDKVE